MIFLNNIHKIYPKRKPLQVHFFTVIGEGNKNVIFAAKNLKISLAAEKAWGPLSSNVTFRETTRSILGKNFYQGVD